MSRFALVAALLLVACVPAAQNDPHAVGPNRDQWRVVIPESPSAAFDAAMRVLSDSSYKIAEARKDAGMIKTDYRKESDVERGGAQLRSMMLGPN